MLNFFPYVPIYEIEGEFDMVRSIPNISIAYTLPHSGRMSLPVDSSSLVYSHFKHVSGTLAPEGTTGVNISKLNLLDVLIGQLNQIKKDGVSPILGEGLDAGHFNATHLDALIESYRQQIEQARAASVAMPYIPSPAAESGSLFSLII